MNKFKVTLLTSMTLAAAIASGQAWALTEGTASGNNSVAIGISSEASGAKSTALGAFSQATGANNIALGSDSKAIGSQHAYAIGQGAEASGTFSISMGFRSSSSVQGGIALGNNSVANRAAGTFGTATEAVSFGSVEKSGSTWVSGYGAVSIGSDTMSRQLTGLAAGSQDNDAVNVAQLKSLQQSSVFGQGSSIEIPASEDGSTPAVNAVNASVLGDSGKVMADAGSAFGANSQVQIGAKGAVAIGANSIATSRLDANGAAPTGYLMPSTGVTDQSVWQADVNHGVVSFGGSYEADDGTGTTQTVTFNRQLTGVAAGSEDNDAVNVAQLKEVDNKVEGLITGDTQVSRIQLLSDPDNKESDRKSVV